MRKSDLYSRERITPLMEVVTEYSNTNRTHINIDKHDVVQLGNITIESLESICDSQEHVLMYSEKVVALNDFIVNCFVTDMNERLCFYFKRYKPGVGCIDLNGGLTTEQNAVVKPLYDAYWLDPDTYDVRVTIQVVRSVDTDGSSAVASTITGIKQDFIPRYAVDSIIRPDKVNFNTAVCTRAYSLFAFVQNQFAECQEVFITKDKKATKVSNISTDSAQSNSRNKQSVTRKIYIYTDYEDRADKEDLENKEHRTIKCPYYTVHGHWRKYKSGKVIWIDSYPKGTERNNPDYIKAKDYIV